MSKQPKNQFDINNENLLNRQVFFDLTKAHNSIVHSYVKDKEKPRFQALIQLEDEFKHNFDITLTVMLTELGNQLVNFK